MSLAAVAGLFFLAGADFLGAVQLMVYVGGTMVLLVFGVMLTARGPFVSMKTGGGQWIMAIIVGGALLADAAPGGLQHSRLDRTAPEQDQTDAAASNASKTRDGATWAWLDGRSHRSARRTGRRPCAAACRAICWRLKSFRSTSWSC